MAPQRLSLRLGLILAVFYTSFVSTIGQTAEQGGNSTGGENSQETPTTGMLYLTKLWSTGKTNRDNGASDESSETKEEGHENKKFPISSWLDGNTPKRPKGEENERGILELSNFYKRDKRSCEEGIEEGNASNSMEGENAAKAIATNRTSSKSGGNATNKMSNLEKNLTTDGTNNETSSIKNKTSEAPIKKSGNASESISRTSTRPTNQTGDLKGKNMVSVKDSGKTNKTSNVEGRNATNEIIKIKIANQTSSINGSVGSASNETTSGNKNQCGDVKAAALPANTELGRWFITGRAVQGEGENTSECKLFSTNDECVDIALNIATNSKNTQESFEMTLTQFNIRTKVYSEETYSIYPISSNYSIYTATTDDGKEFTHLSLGGDEINSYTIEVICSGEVKKYFVASRVPYPTEELVKTATKALKQYGGVDLLKLRWIEDILRDITKLFPVRRHWKL